MNTFKLWGSVTESLPATLINTRLTNQGLEQRPSPDNCRFQHDLSTMSLSIFILVGMLISYLPQHYRIFSSKSSQGINFWFLLLGSTSSTGSLVNVVTLQWGVVRCCKFLSPGSCIESILGIAQVFLQWACFNVILILSLIYFPPDEKYVRVVPVGVNDMNPSPFARATRYSSKFLSKFFLKNKATSSGRRSISRKSNGDPTHPTVRPSLESRQSSVSSTDSDLITSSSSSDSSFDPSNVLPPSATRFTPLTLSKEYTISLVLSIVVLIHFLFSLSVTLCLLLLLPKATVGEPSGSPPSHSGEHPTIKLLRIWALCQGVLSTILAGAQYIPQIWSTWNLKLVGSLSIPMMIVQTPGSFVFVYSLAVRPGVNWTTYLVYAVSGTLQAILLGLCVAWKIRQKTLGINDWGKPLSSSISTSATSSSSSSGARQPRNSERTPLLINPTS